MKEINRNDAQKFIELREYVQNAQNYNEIYKNFEWPEITEFNWGTDYFDKIAANNEKTALIYVDSEGNEIKVSFDKMMRRSNQAASLLSELGMQKGDRVLMMMDTSVETYELFLGIIKMGATIIPASTLLSPADIGDRIVRGEVKFMIAHDKFRERVNKAGDALNNLKALICVSQIGEKCGSDNAQNWIDYNTVKNHNDTFKPGFVTRATDTMFMFFTSGTTSKPKLVVHPHHYPFGHLTTMYWLDLQKNDVHYNISSPGWAKFAWSSFITPWNAEATIFTYNYSAFDPAKNLEFIEKYKISSLCAPLSVWKLFLLQDISKYNLRLKKIVSAGEPLNPEVSNKVNQVTGLALREGYGQTETTALIFTPKGMTVPEGSMGKVAPGYQIKIVDENLNEVPHGTDGEIAVAMQPVRPLGLLDGYDDDEKNREIFKDNWYLTGDTAYMNEDGFVFFIGRSDDVFKSLDYRISPFEVESEIMEHAAVLEVAVIPTVDDRDRIVPKAYIVLKPGYPMKGEMALELFRSIRGNMAPYKRPRSIEFMKEFPKTISAKVMRKDLRQFDLDLKKNGKRGEYEFFEKDFAKELELGKRR
jgi:acetyl-CoA synthetase